MHMHSSCIVQDGPNGMCPSCKSKSLVEQLLHVAAPCDFAQVRLIPDAGTTSANTELLRQTLYGTSQGTRGSAHIIAWHCIDQRGQASSMPHIRKPVYQKEHLMRMIQACLAARGNADGIGDADIYMVSSGDKSGLSFDQVFQTSENKAMEKSKHMFHIHFDGDAIAKRRRLQRGASVNQVSHCIASSSHSAHFISTLDKRRLPSRSLCYHP